jgi:hypothetical protein
MSAVSAGTTGIAAGAPGSSRTSPPTSLAAVARLLATILPNATTPEGELTLELVGGDSRPARMIDAKIIEGHAIRARRIFDPPEVGFVAFLDGIQESAVALYLATGAPVVQGIVAAVIRERRNRRMFTWRHAVERRLYASRTSVPSAFWNEAAALGFDVCDTGGSEGSAGDIEHPFALRDSAKHRVQRDREQLEQGLALEWCRTDGRPILVDGPISGADAVARSACAIGVIKSHRTLYVSGEAMTTVFGLGVAERSSVFLIESPKRTNVASFYLRLRDRRGHDPMWGLVRVEIAVDGSDISARADQASRWILAEASPVALPDARWDKMVYGIRDCEEFLRAIR